MVLPIDHVAFAYLGYAIRYTTALACAREAAGDDAVVIICTSPAASAEPAGALETRMRKRSAT
jgi:hypothetical protein